MNTQQLTQLAVRSTRSIRFVRALATLSLCGLAACAGIRVRPAYQVPQHAYDGRLLTSREIEGTDARTAYDAIQRLRPEYLRWTRGSEAGQATMAVYVDHMRTSGVEQLRLIPAASVRVIRFLRAYEATFQYGDANEAGALDVVTGAPERADW